MRPRMRRWPLIRVEGGSRERYSRPVNRIDDIFAGLRRDGRKALMPFICGQHPGPGATPGVLQALQGAGASIVEIGIPFSDPIADGPVIAAAMHTALERGATIEGLLSEISASRPGLSVGLVAMCSVSILHRLAAGSTPAAVVERFRGAGFDGFIFPDLPLEESEAWRSAARDAGMTSTLLIAPTTPFERAEQIAKACTGFIYLLARAGITGERADLPDIAGRVQKLRTMSDLPIAVGFGVSSAEHVRHVVSSADAAIVGSALVRRISDATGAAADANAAAAQVAGEFGRQLAAGLG